MLLKIRKLRTICIYLFFFLPIVSTAQEVLVAPPCNWNLTGWGNFELDDLWRLSSHLSSNLSRSTTYSNGTNSSYSLKMSKSPEFHTSSYYVLGQYKKYHIKAKFFVPNNSTLNATDNSEVSLKFLKKNTSSWSSAPVSKYIVRNGVRGSWVDLFSRKEVLQESGEYIFGLNWMSNFSQGESYIDNLEFLEICSLSAIPEVQDVSTCNGNDGRIEITLYGGEKPYLAGQPEYSFKTMWEHSNATLDNNIVVITGLKAGTYKVRVGDLNSANLPDAQFNNYLLGGYARELTFNIKEPQSALPIISNINFLNNLCTTRFEAVVSNPQNCTLSYNWNFGDGSTSTEPTPFHSYSNTGTYIVSLSVDYNCPCQSGGTINFQKTFVRNGAEDIFQQIQIQIPSEEKKQVLSSSATTYSDAWPLHHINPQLANKESFLNGTMGIWRGEASYVYAKDRNYSSSLDISKDGTYSLQQFNWEYADLEAVPNWIKINTMTEYSPFSYEVENRDVLGRYSSALYDYGGQLPTANGVNMRYNEMAFTSFESTKDKVSGNWQFGTSPQHKPSKFKINKGYRNIALVQGKLDDFNGIDEVEVWGRNIGQFIFRIIKTKIVCRQVFKDNPNWTYLVP